MQHGYANTLSAPVCMQYNTLYSYVKSCTCACTCTCGVNRWVCQKSGLAVAVSYAPQLICNASDPFPGKGLETGLKKFTYSSHGISHFDDKGVSSVGTGADGVRPASMEPPRPTTFIRSSRVTIQPVT